jgi:ABC-type multidrug transport system fused ATPase/permease subunit
LIVFFAGLLAVLAGSRAGIAGMSLNNALSITSLLNWAVRNGAETESLMNSVERVLFISSQTPNEASTSSAALQVAPLSSNWPSRGEIVFEDVWMSYRDGFDAVLKGVNLRIRPGERIGIVGRSGSGKSSLFRALLRLTELNDAEAMATGRISIDGENIRALELDRLRSAISVIPQDPVLFSGSLRFNLDPFNAHEDAVLWQALQRANLAAYIRSLPDGLSTRVAEGGENFSAGQRQLLCLARALVRKSRILLFDEATSSVDVETDALIQTAIRSVFQDTAATVLTIAHRLDTILDADRILVMEDGRVAEFDSPMNLLRNSSSVFAQLVAIERAQKINRVNLVNANTSTSTSLLL